VDCGQAVVHVMQPAIRQYYRLEEIWGGKPVRLRKAPPPAARGPRPKPPLPQRPGAAAGQPTTRHEVALAGGGAAPAGLGRSRL
jgi:ribosome-associated protein